MTQNLLQHGTEVVACQPFSVLLGTRVDALEPGHAELSLPVTPHVLQQHGYVHGGVVSYLADNALTYAGGSLLGDAVTSEMKINYVRPAVGCTRLVAIASVAAAGRTQAVCRCDVFRESDDGVRVLCAVAQGTIRKLERAEA